jgi:hypothetical protein
MRFFPPNVQQMAVSILTLQSKILEGPVYLASRVAIADTAYQLELAPSILESVFAKI